MANERTYDWNKQTHPISRPDLTDEQVYTGSLTGRITQYQNIPHHYIARNPILRGIERMIEPVLLIPPAAGKSTPWNELEGAMIAMGHSYGLAALPMMDFREAILKPAENPYREIYGTGEVSCGKPLSKKERKLRKYRRKRRR